MNITKNMTRRRRRAVTAGFAGCCLACGLAVALPADADSSFPLVPDLYCVATASPTSATAYFGYVNTGAPTTVTIGPDNEVIPGLPYQGQPDYFNTGSYPSVFSVTYNPSLGNFLLWSLIGIQVGVSPTSPQCDPGTTSPASDVSDTAATLNGVVTPDGTDTTYQFEYGTTTSFGSTTTVTDAGSGYSPAVVQAPLTGLTPSTTYYFRLDTTTTYVGGQATSDGQQEQFTTAATPAPAPTVTETVTATPSPAPTVTVTATPAGLALLTTALPAGKVGVPYSGQLSASGGTPPYTWLVTGGFLPPGLRLDRTTGLLSGGPWLPGSYPVEITVTDSAAPARASLSERYTITIAR